MLMLDNSSTKLYSPKSEPLCKLVLSFPPRHDSSTPYTKKNEINLPEHQTYTYIYTAQRRYDNMDNNQIKSIRHTRASATNQRVP